MRSLIPICAGSVWLSAQTPEQSSALLLSRVRHHALENLSRQPNYTCVETVERWQRSGASRKFQLLDTLRPEVALVDSKEMFGWPGARQFEDTDLRKLVTGGAIGNGNFALYARSIFGGDAATFQYHDESPLDGRPSVRFDFRVKSGFTITTAEKAPSSVFTARFRPIRNRSTFSRSK